MKIFKIKYALLIGLLSSTFFVVPLSRRLFNENLTDNLFAAIQKGDKKEVLTLLNKGANPNAQKAKKTALMGAIALTAADASEGIVEELLKAGANPNTSDVSDLTPLAFAAYYGKSAIIQLLLKYGATVTADKSLQELTENKSLIEDPYSKAKRERKEIEKEWYLIPKEELDEVEEQSNWRNLLKVIQYYLGY